MTDTLDLGAVKAYLREFAADRDWQQFHTPKNLAMALAGEVGELVELFQWLTPGESGDVMANPVKKEAVEGELADVLQYVIRLADVLDVDIDAVLWRKLKLNEGRYPVDRVKGSALKYTELG